MTIQNIRITRYRLDGTRCGMAQGRHAAWNWAYHVHCDGSCDVACGRSGYHDMGRGLRSAREIARRIALRLGLTQVVEDWRDGKRFSIGKRGGLVLERPSVILEECVDPMGTYFVLRHVGGSLVSDEKFGTANQAATFGRRAGYAIVAGAVT